MANSNYENIYSTILIYDDGFILFFIYGSFYDIIV